MKVHCFLLFVFFFLLLVIVTFLRFVVSSSPIRITLESKQIVPFSPHPSPLSALPLLHVVFFFVVCFCLFVFFTYIHTFIQLEVHRRSQDSALLAVKERNRPVGELLKS